MTRAWTLVLALALGCEPISAPLDGALPDRDGAVAPAVTLPIEVFGEAGHTVSVPLRVLSGAPATTLYLRVHRPTWLELGSFADRGPKMAVRFDGGDFFEVEPQRVRDWPTWGTAAAGDSRFPVIPSNVDCHPADAQFGGCLAGTYHTVRFTIPLSRMGAALSPGAHTLDFQFLGTDGTSMGYRVLDLDVRAADGTSLIDRSGFAEEDPDTWTPPHDDADSIREGERLWTSATLLTSPIDATPLHAHCNSCHALDGRDLAYFNFSNASIVQRSVFHGLSEDQGALIASFIRSVDLRLPPGMRVSELGRPWDPPYQPGPGLDARPAVAWAAGAGLDAVLDTDVEMAETLFGDAGIATSPRPGGPALPLLGADGYLNPREVPQALQYPDWMSWLPHLAPEDMTTRPEALFETSWYAGFESIREALESDRDGFLYTDVAAHIPSQPNLFTIAQFSSGWPSEGMAYRNHPEGNGLNWKHGHEGDWVTTTEESVIAAQYNLAMATYRNLRKWEIFNTYELEEIEGYAQTNFAGTLYTAPAGSRVWPTANRDMFEIAPHFSGPAYLDRPFTFDDTAVGDYWTTAWYSLQQILNGGYQVMTVTGPVDWNYHVPHIGGRPDLWELFPAQPHRMFWGTLFMLQAIPHGSPQTNFDWPIGHLHDALGTSGVRDIDEALADAFLGVVGRYPLESWPRKLGGDAGFADRTRFERADAAPDEAGLESAATSSYVWDVIANACHEGRYADCYYLRIRSMHDRGAVSAATLDRLIDWTCRVWPLYPWAALASRPTWSCPA